MCTVMVKLTTLGTTPSASVEGARTSFPATCETFFLRRVEPCLIKRRSYFVVQFFPQGESLTTLNIRCFSNHNCKPCAHHSAVINTWKHQEKTTTCIQSFRASLNLFFDCHIGSVIHSLCFSSSTAVVVAVVLVVMSMVCVCACVCVCECECVRALE